MLLVIDVGNTHITLGVFEEKELKGTFRMTTGYSRTSDEYGIFICNMLEYRGINKDLVDAAAAYELYGGPVLIADFGTATTYDLVNEKGEFIAEITSPGLKDLKVVATGGLGKVLARETEAIDVYDQRLTLEGLRIIYEKNKEEESRNEA